MAKLDKMRELFFPQGDESVFFLMFFACVSVVLQDPTVTLINNHK